jgi:hypothetical protein
VKSPVEQELPALVEVGLAADWIRAVLVPLNYCLAAPDLAEIVVRCEAVAMLIDRTFLLLLDGIRATCGRRSSSALTCWPLRSARPCSARKPAEQGLEHRAVGDGERVSAPEHRSGPYGLVRTSAPLLTSRSQDRTGRCRMECSPRWRVNTSYGGPYRSKQASVVSAQRDPDVVTRPKPRGYWQRLHSEVEVLPGRQPLLWVT